MRSIPIETSRHIHIDYPAAGASDRIMAYLVDLFIQALYSIIIYLSLFYLLGGTRQWVLISFIAIPVFFYHLIMEMLLGGQSPGKKVLNIKVVRRDGSASTLGNYLTRWIFRLIEIIPTSGSLALFTILFNGKGQRLGDIAAGTTVVKTKRDTALSDTIYAAKDNDYEPRFPQVSVLEDEDIAVIKRVLTARPKYERDIYIKMIRKTRENIEKKTGIGVTNLHTVVFLQTVIKDYNAIYG